MPHGDADLGELTPQSVFYDQGRFGRLFPTLPPFAADTTLIRDALAELGAAGGPMDPGDDLSDPITLITDPAKSVHNPNNPTITAGFTFLGQFLDHDMTFDPTSSLARRQDPESIRNFRIPALDLDSVYGGGPGASPQLYDQTVDGGRTTLLTEEIPGSAAVSIDSATRLDLPRNSQHVAITGDPRNDENLIVSQLHLAVMRFHNRVVADVTAELGVGYTPQEIFAEAQRVVRWHYQWLILHEFLPKTVGQAMVDDVLTGGPKHFKWRNDPFIPVEFSVAAYRFGERHRPIAAVLRALHRPHCHRPGRPGRPAGRAARPPTVHRLADLLRLRRRSGALQQEGRHQALDGPVQPAGPTRGRADVAGDPQPAAQPDDEGTVGPASGAGDAAARAGTGRHRRPAAVPAPQAHAAVVLRPS